MSVAPSEMPARCPRRTDRGRRCRADCRKRWRGWRGRIRCRRRMPDGARLPALSAVRRVIGRVDAESVATRDARSVGARSLRVAWGPGGGLGGRVQGRVGGRVRGCIGPAVVRLVGCVDSAFASVRGPHRRVHRGGAVRRGVHLVRVVGRERVVCGGVDGRISDGAAVRRCITLGVVVAAAALREGPKAAGRQRAGRDRRPLRARCPPSSPARTVAVDPPASTSGRLSWFDGYVSRNAYRSPAASAN